jgi:hypothetical protein
LTPKENIEKVPKPAINDRKKQFYMVQEGSQKNRTSKIK